MVLYENSVMASLVHTDFSDEIANSGDVVNTRRPAKFEGKRKVDSDDVTTQDAVAPNVAVKLDQHWHVSFIIKDGEESKGFANLRNTFLVPALEAIAKSVDEVVLNERYNFLGNLVGNLATPVGKRTMIDAQTKLDGNSVPTSDRWFAMSSKSKADLLDVVDFTQADKVGDDGTAVREGFIGRKFGFNTVLAQNLKTVADGGPSSVALGAVNNGGGYAAGTTTLVVDTFTGEVLDGSWVTIAGDDTPQLVTAHVGAVTTSITISPGLRSAVADDAVVVQVLPAAVNNVPGYPADHTKEIVIDGITVAPSPMQLASFGTNGITYGLNGAPLTTSILLNRALEAAVANDDVVGLGPSGEFNLGFHRNAIGLISRPLALPDQATGVRGAVADLNGIGVRVVITYDGVAQGHRVTVDLLAGVKTLDADMGTLVLGS
jgi:hypothetical protein